MMCLRASGKSRGITAIDSDQCVVAMVYTFLYCEDCVHGYKVTYINVHVYLHNVCMLRVRLSAHLCHR